MNYRFNATKLISEEFGRNELDYHVRNLGPFEEVCIPAPTDCGLVEISYVSSDDDNDVMVRWTAFRNIPISKRVRILETINHVNQDNRYFKAVLSKGNVDIRYDFVIETSDDCIGESALEIFVRAKHYIDDTFALFQKAIFTDEDLNLYEFDMKSMEKFAERIKRLCAENDEDEAEEDCE